MPSPNKKRVDELPLAEQMKGKAQNPSLIKPATGQNIQVRYDQYFNVRDIVSASMRRKLAGEFPYNMLEREITISTSTFWQELLQAVIVDMYYNHDPKEISEELFLAFVDNIGGHPSAWDKFVDEQHIRDHYTEFVNAIP